MYGQKLIFCQSILICWQETLLLCQKVFIRRLPKNVDSMLSTSICNENWRCDVAKQEWQFWEQTSICCQQQWTLCQQKIGFQQDNSTKKGDFHLGFRWKWSWIMLNSTFVMFLDLKGPKKNRPTNNHPKKTDSTNGLVFSFLTVDLDTVAVLQIPKSP